MQSQDRLRIAILAAYAIGLHGLERMIPAPLPWMRFGFANIITLTALILYGLRVAMTITLIRVLIVSLLTGSFLGPGFVLSLGGGVASTLIMSGAYSLFSALFSPVGISLIGSMAHNLTQLTLAYLLFVRRMEAILFITPIILLLGIITGMINGMASGLLLKKLGEEGASPRTETAMDREP
ncbi:MAG: Gx transporter family protein [Nitrospirae bacterium]|nr:Gx transporter family protein [Nitrospirota bacterium]